MFLKLTDVKDFSEEKDTQEKLLDIMIKNNLAVDLATRMKEPKNDRDNEFRLVFNEMLPFIFSIMHFYDIEFTTFDFDNSDIAQYLINVMAVPFEDETQEKYKKMFDKICKKDNYNKIIFDLLTLILSENVMGQLYDKILEEYKKNNVKDSNGTEFLKNASEFLESKKDLLKEAGKKITADESVDEETLFLSFVKYVSAQYKEAINKINNNSDEYLDKCRKAVLKHLFDSLTSSINSDLEEEPQIHA